MTPVSKRICVYCSASRNLSPAYHEVAAQLGQLLAERRHTLIYGGGSVGLMGEVARAAHRGGGQIIGIIPKMLVSVEFTYQQASEVIITEDMRERKTRMEAHADAFLALPGGIGTLEEIFEIMSLRGLNQTTHPLVLINTGGFYNPLDEYLQKMHHEHFVRRPVNEIYYLAPDVYEALRYVEAHA
ncbi:MAG: TIGR00730 family Rossman fold protein [Anaerolineae bacterium]|nr:TIGR00730 family Rossman fold protein [Anaerolineae bacterium]NUQ05709.1 TIGR00730 family Rossman fold protein [Anaerolineae bacterium]